MRWNGEGNGSREYEQWSGARRMKMVIDIWKETQLRRGEKRRDVCEPLLEYAVSYTC